MNANNEANETNTEPCPVCSEVVEQFDSEFDLWAFHDRHVNVEANTDQPALDSWSVRRGKPAGQWCVKCHNLTRTVVVSSPERTVSLEVECTECGYRWTESNW